MTSTHRTHRPARHFASRRSASLVFVALAATLVLAACGGNGGEGAPTATAAEATETAGEATETTEAETTEDDTTQEETTQEETTQEGPEPITPAEKRWLRLLTKYTERFDRVYFRSGQVTHASMRREAELFRDCRAMLRRAGDPGRLEPAAKPARRACQRLDNAARLLDQAIAASDLGGAVVVGTPEERIFNRSRNRASEAAGNAYGGLQRAQEIAKDIEGDLRS